MCRITSTQVCATVPTQLMPIEGMLGLTILIRVVNKTSQVVIMMHFIRRLLRCKKARVHRRALKVLPVTTYSCITRGYCCHREYKTFDSSQSKCQSISAIQDPVTCGVVCVCLAIKVSSPCL